MSQFKGVPAWTHDEATDQSYLHSFLAEQPDLNWANPEVEAAMHDVLRFWLDRGVDGFRADVVHLIGKGDDVPDLPEDRARAIVLHIDRPLGHDLLHRVRRLLDSYPHHPMMVGEVYLLGEGESASYVGTPEKPELHLSFDFRPVHTPWDAERFRHQLSKGQADFTEPRWPTWVLSNHDRVRHRSRHGSDERARVAAVMSLTVRGTPFLYAGEELGLEDGVVPDDRVVDPDGRDGCRAPIPWTSDGDLEVGHGWGDSPWLPFPANTSTNSADRQVGVDGSIHSLYRDLIRLRRDTAALRRGAMTVEESDGEIIRYRRELDGDVLEIAINMADDHAPWPDGLDGHLLASSDPRRTSPGGNLAGPEAVIIRTS
jgi:alpha-glucosidase